MAHDSAESTKAHIQRVRDLLMQVINDLGARHAGGGDLRASIDANQDRFGYGAEIYNILINTAEYLGWL